MVTPSITFPALCGSSSRNPITFMRGVDSKHDGYDAGLPCTKNHDICPLDHKISIIRKDIFYEQSVINQQQE